jgi:hypothetical protein
LHNVLNEETSEFASYKPDVVVGTDVIYRPLSVAMLVKALNWLFKGRQEGSLIFFLCYQKRHDYTHRLMLDDFSKNSFSCCEVYSEGKTFIYEIKKKTGI